MLAKLVTRDFFLYSDQNYDLTVYYCLSFSTTVHVAKCFLYQTQTSLSEGHQVFYIAHSKKSLKVIISIKVTSVHITLLESVNLTLELIYVVQLRLVSVSLGLLNIASKAS